MAAKKGLQARVSELTHARAVAIQAITDSGIGWQLDRAHEEWVAKNYPEVYKSVSVDEKPKKKK